jgi:gluconate 5-dehydrogenase
MMKIVAYLPNGYDICYGYLIRELQKNIQMALKKELEKLKAYYGDSSKTEDFKNQLLSLREKFPSEKEWNQIEDYIKDLANESIRRTDEFVKDMEIHKNERLKTDNSMTHFSLKGKTALVTGASYGIGFAIASALAEAGAAIVFNDLNQEFVDRGLRAYRQAGIEARGYVCDVTCEEAVNALTRQVEREAGAIHILVNNAGIIKRIPMHLMSAGDFRQVIDVDLVAPFILAKAVLPSMIQNGGGKIINICSMMSELGRETVAAYAAAKGGLKMLTRNMASEYGRYNIQCNGLGPGYIATPQTAPLREKQPGGLPHPFDAFIIAKTPAARWGTPQDLAGPAVFLASPASDFVNGHILYVDGGILAYTGKQP